MGACDYTHDSREYTYALPAGVCGAVPNFPADFSVAHDTAYLISSVKDILTLEMGGGQHDAHRLGRQPLPQDSPLIINGVLRAHTLMIRSELTTSTVEVARARLGTIMLEGRGEEYVNETELSGVRCGQSLLRD